MLIIKYTIAIFFFLLEGFTAKELSSKCDMANEVASAFPIKFFHT